MMSSTKNTTYITNSTVQERNMDVKWKLLPWSLVNLLNNTFILQLLIQPEIVKKQFRIFAACAYYKVNLVSSLSAPAQAC